MRTTKCASAHICRVDTIKQYNYFDLRHGGHSRSVRILRQFPFFYLQWKLLFRSLYPVKLDIDCISTYVTKCVSHTYAGSGFICSFNATYFFFEKSTSSPSRVTSGIVTIPRVLLNVLYQSFILN